MSLRRSALNLQLETCWNSQALYRQHVQARSKPLLSLEFAAARRSRVAPFLNQQRCPTQRRTFSISPVFGRDASVNSGSSSKEQSTAEPKSATIYTYEDILKLTKSPDPSRILIDVREPSELSTTGRIPTAKNIPLRSAIDFAHLSADDFEHRFGFAKPTQHHEVIFYCLAGVRSRAAARLAHQARFAGSIGDFSGSWEEWVGRAGEVEVEKGERGGGG